MAVLRVDATNDDLALRILALAVEISGYLVFHGYRGVPLFELHIQRDLDADDASPVLIRSCVMVPVEVA